MFWLPASKHLSEMHRRTVNSCCTMIICNPNMGYAEALQYSSEWLEFYLKRGINLVLWNYRGFSKSTGIPTPTALENDIELVYEWAR